MSAFGAPLPYAVPHGIGFCVCKAGYGDVRRRAHWLMADGSWSGAFEVGEPPPNGAIIFMSEDQALRHARAGVTP